MFHENEPDMMVAKNPWDLKWLLEDILVYVQSARLIDMVCISSKLDS